MEGQRLAIHCLICERHSCVKGHAGNEFLLLVHVVVGITEFTMNIQDLNNTGLTGKSADI